MELIQQSEIQKESSEFAVELRKVEEEDKVMVNSYAMFQMRQAVSRSEMLLKIRVLKKFANFTGKHSCWSLCLMKFQG